MKDLLDELKEDTTPPQRRASGWENPLWEDLPEEILDGEALSGDGEWDVFSLEEE